ncbi:YihY family inner membrane protein [Pleionea sediminis]|uniref:YihY family inner membrane protein n=1 Tax=Pleionea sediminis TaxID=2569479 RepID=UPI0011865975|nr:YihY family inner membrane protein [Pleionea sediminis]
MEEKLVWLKQFIAFTFDRFGKDHCRTIAAELTVTSLLSMIPFLTVVLALLSLFPQFQEMEADVQQLIFTNLMPESSQTVENFINKAIKNTQGMTLVGAVFLLVTSMMLMHTIDQSFNKIWQVKKKSSPVRVFLVYWAVLTMGPLLLAMSLAVSSYFASLPLVSDVVQSKNSIMARIIPLFMAFVAFTVMFIAVPNRRVKIKHAAIAAIFTAFAFELVKYGFGLFVKTFSTYQLIYGALASVPLFIIWMQVSWMILLIGAEICHALGVFQPESKKVASHPFVLAARILKLLVNSQAHREVVDMKRIQQELPNVQLDSLAKVIDRLEKANLIIELDGGGFTLSGDSQSYQLSEIIEAGIVELPDEKAIERLAQDDKELADRIAVGRSALIKKLSDPLVAEPNQG